MTDRKMPATLVGALADAERYSNEAWTDAERLAFKQGCWAFAMLLVHCQQSNAVQRSKALLEEALSFENDLRDAEA